MGNFKHPGSVFSEKFVESSANIPSNAVAATGDHGEILPRPGRMGQMSDMESEINMRLRVGIYYFNM